MQLLGLIGYPLSHSFSQAWFTKTFRDSGLTDVIYDNFPLEDISQLPVLLSDTPDLCGFNVTAPHKESVIRYLDEIDPVAEEIGAVNCVTRCNGILKGYNVDWIGFSRSLEAFISSCNVHSAPYDKNESPRQDHRIRAIILGSGGASKAAAYALRRMNIDYIRVSRNPDGKPDTTGYDQLSQEIMNTHILIINATPLGTHPDISKAPPIPYQWLTGEHMLYDMVYNPPSTLFMQYGEAAGAAATNGLEMLRSQAEESLKLFLPQYASLYI